MAVRHTLAKTAKIQPYDPSAVSFLKSLILRRVRPQCGQGWLSPQKVSRTTRAGLFGQLLRWQSGQLTKISTMPISPKVQLEISRQHLPGRLSFDHDPLFEFHRWQANLRILQIQSVRSVRYAPVSHPFIERLIGTIRREYLDRMFFWNRVDLEQKLEDFKGYYNQFRVHQSLQGETPTGKAGGPTAEPGCLEHYSWQSHCHGLFELPIAA